MDKNHNPWLIDNGASIHMTLNINLFDELDTNASGKICLANGNPVEIQEKRCYVKLH